MESLLLESHQGRFYSNRKDALTFIGLLFCTTLLCCSTVFGQSNALQAQLQQTAISVEKIRVVPVIDNPSNLLFVKLDEIAVDEQNAGHSVSASSTGPTKVTLEQVRNGSGSSPVNPGAWAAGNLNGSQAHYAEKWSIPYRLTFTGISTGSHTVIIEWDVKQSGKNALDYITHYASIDNGVGSHLSTFGHVKESIDPTIGFSGLSSRSQFVIDPPPSDVAGTSFTNLPNDSLKKMSIWNGTITSLTYGPAADLTQDAASQQLTIIFNATSSTVVLSWGGHIASIADWGLGNSASSISGSPYHTRLISFDGSGGNQDRSLSADAVIDPPTCNISGPTGSVSCNTTSQFTNNSTIPSGYTYTWTLNPNSSGASIVGAAQDGSLSNVNPIQVNSGSNACSKSYTVVLTIYKNGVQVGSPCTYAVTVNDNTAPTIGSPGANATISCPSTPSFTAPTASDACSTASVQLVSDVTSAGSCAGTYTETKTWKAVDACGNQSGTVAQTITVQDNTAPFIGSPGANATISCPATPTFTEPTASDACGGASVQLVSDVTSAGSCTGTYTETKTWKAVDACGNQSGTVAQTITVRDNTAPVIGSPGANATLSCTATPTFTPPTASDACSSASVQLVSDVTTAGSCGNNYDRTVTWRAIDACGNQSGTVAQTISVMDNIAPIIGSPGANATIFCPATPTFTAPTASDACNSASVQLVSDITAAGTCAGAFTETKTWKAVDACGNQSGTVAQTITVRDNTAPTIGSPGANSTIDCTATPSFTAPTASDECSTASVQTIGADVTTSGGCAGSYTVRRTWRAVDACNNQSGTVAQTITVRDITAPVFSNCPANLTVDFCSGSVPPPANVTATDNCSGVSTVTFSEIQSGSNCNNTITRTWIATDGCGNSNTCSQVITVKTRPLITCPPDKVLACGSSSDPTNTGTPTAYSPCSSVTITHQDVLTTTSACAGNVKNIDRTWTATDVNGNSSSCLQHISFDANLSLTTSRSAINSENVTPSQPTVKAYPNPFSDKINFVVTTPISGKGSLEVYNMMGQKVRTVYQGFISSGTQTFQMSSQKQQVANLIYVLRIGEKKISGRILQINQ